VPFDTVLLLRKLELAISYYDVETKLLGALANVQLAHLQEHLLGSEDGRRITLESPGDFAADPLRDNATSVAKCSLAEQESMTAQT
jgi:hypothetical protein